jgi:hypothetical protein
MNINETKTYKAILLLDEIIVNERVFCPVMSGDDKLLELSLTELHTNGYLTIENGEYFVSEKGEAVYNTFMDRYREFLKVYDLYSCVDLVKGEFAFSKFFDFADDEQWNLFKNQERFYDVRIAVAKFKKINATEIVFMSFINENRFDTKNKGWQLNLILDTMWGEIDTIVNTAITVEDLGTDVLENIINQGTALMMSLINKEIEIKKQALEQAKAEQLCMADDDEGAEQTEEYIIETTTIITEYEEDIDYYAPYYDPYYYNPIWILPLFACYDYDYYCY